MIETLETLDKRQCYEIYNHDLNEDSWAQHLFHVEVQIIYLLNGVIRPVPVFLRNRIPFQICLNISIKDPDA